MSTKWLEKLVEQKLVGLSLMDNSEILWARKNSNKEKITVELLVLENLHKFNSEEYFDSGVKQLIKDLKNFNIKLLDKSPNTDVKLFLKNKKEFLNTCPNLKPFEFSGDSINEILRDTGLSVSWYKVDGDFGNLEDLLYMEDNFFKDYFRITPAKEMSFKRSFTDLLSKFFYQTYYCEAMIDNLEQYKTFLEKRAQNQNFNEKLKTAEKIQFCARKIVDFTSELIAYENLEVKRNIKKGSIKKQNVSENVK